MATTFLEPGGDATFDLTLFDPNVGASTQPTVVSDFVHGGHVKSIGYAINSSSSIGKKAVVADAGGRQSVYVYFNAYPNATSSIIDVLTTGYNVGVLVLRMTSAGVLQLFSSGVQLGTNGGTVTSGAWHRISFAYTVTSTTVYTFKAWLDGVLTLTVTNTGTLAGTGTADILFGNVSGNTTLDMRTSDHYMDNSSALTDPASDVWVTAKRPVSNGTTNGFTTQIGSGGSGYGTGHAPQVNERPLSQTNGWSMVGAGGAVTEEYTIESASTGDINIASATLIDFMGWVFGKALLSETGSIVLAGATSNIALTSTATAFLKAAGSTSYPAGGTDIGIVTSTTVTTVSLYECGTMFAYTPATTVTASGSTFLMMGV